MSEQMVRFEEFFAAPREQVFAWFAQPENFGQMFPGRARRIRDATSGADVNGLGSVREVRVGLSRREETITAFRPPACIEYRVTRGWPVKNHRACLMFESVEGGTHLEYVIEFDSRVPLAGSLLAGVLCRSWRRGMTRAVEAIAGA